MDALTENGIGDQGATSLSEALKVNTTLTSLEISNYLSNS